MPDQDPYAAFSSPAQKGTTDPYAAFSSPAQTKETNGADLQGPLKPYTLKNGKQTVQRSDGAFWLDQSKGSSQSPGWYRVVPGTEDGRGLAGGILGQAPDVLGGGTHQLGEGTPVQNFMHGASASFEGGMQLMDRLGSRVTNALGLTKPAEVAAQQHQEDMSRAAQEAEYQRTRYQGRGSTLAELGGFMTVPIPGPQALGAAKLLSKPAARILGRTALAGAGMASLQPVMTTPDIKGDDDYWSHKTKQAVLGGTLAPFLQAGLEKAVIPAGSAVIGKLSDLLNGIKGNPGESFAPEVIKKWFSDRVNGPASDALQEDLANQYAAARAKGGAPFQALRAEGGTLSMTPYTDKIDEAISHVDKSGFTGKKALINQLEEMKTVAQDGPMTWGKALDIGTDINDKMAQAMSGQNPDRNLARILKPIKEAHQEALDQAGAQFGEAYKQAKSAWIEHVVPWEDPKQGGRLIRNFINSPTPDAAMDALLKAKSEDKVGIFVGKLSKDRGIPALQAGLVDAVYKQSLDESGTVIPAKFIGALKARQDAYDLAFTGEAKWKMDGLNTLMKDSRFTARLLTGEFLRNMPGGRILPGSAFPTPDAGSFLQKLFTTPIGSKLLLRASSSKPGSPAVQAIIDQLPKVAGIAGAKTSANVPLESFPAAAEESNSNSNQAALTEPRR